jgi:glycine/D-amino acid oxidase-like deaminating enzyme
VRTLCTRLIDWLEDTNSVFRWSHRLDLADLEEVAEGDVIWAAGVSSGSVSLLAHHGVLLQGVLGCWITLPNTSISQPFKLLAREPVNFINATPVGKTLLVSGGYGWVGERPYAEAASLSRPLARSFEKEVQRLIRADVEGSLGYDSALCIRPSLPSGVPLIGQLRFPGRRRPVLACVGHAAGGFTEAPAVADQVVELLDETPS